METGVDRLAVERLQTLISREADFGKQRFFALHGVTWSVGSAITKHLELTVNGETRTFQNVDLRPLTR